MAHGITVEQKRCTVRALLPEPVQLGQAPHGDASGHDEQGGDEPAQWSEHRCRDLGSEAWEKGSKVHRGLLRRLVSVAVVVDDNSPTVLRQQPFLMSAFWRRSCEVSYLFMREALCHGC